MGFSALQLKDWQQFGQVDISFHDRLTVLTGANGTGKTTILRLLARHFGHFNYTSLSVPYKDPQSGRFRFLTRLFQAWSQVADSRPLAGKIAYTTGKEAEIRVPFEQSAIQYQVEIPGQPSVPGLFIPSHRPEFDYQQVQSIPVRARTQQEALSAAIQGLRNSNSIYNIKEVLVGLALFGPGNENVEADPQANRLYEGYQQVLRQLLPKEFGFKRFTVRNSSEVLLVTDTGEFLIDSVSGGISALLLLGWLMFVFSFTNPNPFTVLIDEPENHLHPAMQRHLLPNLLNAFPQASFIVATHSPLIVGSVRDSNVYALLFRPRDGTAAQVESSRLDFREKAGSASQILREVLDVPFSRPVWVETFLAGLSDRFQDRPLDKQVLATLRQELAANGLQEWLPEVLVDMSATKARRRLLP